MKNKIILSLFVVMGLNALAQQDPMYTQYMDNQIYVNPAFAGSKEYLEIAGIHRQQWFGITGAPMTTTLAIHTPLNYQSVGLGLSLMNDQLGPVNRFNANIDFAYRIHFSNESKISLGLKAGIDSYSSSFRDIDRTGVDALSQELNGALTPTFGFGAYYMANKWFIGASIPRITSNLSGQVGGIDEAKHIFGVAGLMFDLNQNWQLRPTTQIRYTQGAPISADLSVAGIWNEKFWIGGTYRLAESAGIFVQYRIVDQFKIGYAYDFPLTELRQSTLGSHELLLSFGLIKKQKNLVSPRYFN